MKAYRGTLGENLKEFRVRRGLTVEQVAARGGVRPGEVSALEGGGAVALDTLLGYALGCDLYIYLAEKGEGRKRPHDFDDIAQRAAEADPGDWMREGGDDNGRD